jgi:hypothetical protein
MAFSGGLIELAGNRRVLFALGFVISLDVCVGGMTIHWR